MKMQTPTFRTLPLLSGAVMLALAGCHTTPPRNAQLDEAQRMYQQAAASPDVAGGAQLELERARKTLAQAQHVWADKRDTDETAHLAYVATQQTQAAINVGMQKAADSMVTSAGVARERVKAEANEMNAEQAKAAAQSANQRADQLEQELQSMSGKQTTRGLVVVLQDVLFDTGRAELKSGAQTRLARLADVLKKHPERHLLIEGFTDSTGSNELNQTLSERRAQSVKDALVGMGIGADRIETRGFGEARPVASNKTAAGRQQNRRVEVVFSDANGAFAAP